MWSTKVFAAEAVDEDKGMAETNWKHKVTLDWDDLIRWVQIMCKMKCKISSLINPIHVLKELVHDWKFSDKNIPHKNTVIL